MKETKDRSKRYVPELKARMFYSWSFVLMLGPVAVQTALYQAFCASSECRVAGSWPWICLAVLLLPGTALLHWTMKRLVREETGELKAAIERGGKGSLPRSKLKSFYTFPGRIAWISLPLAVVYLFPLSFSTFPLADAAVSAALFLVPLSFYAMVFCMFAVKGSAVIERLGRFIPQAVVPSKITGSLRRSLLAATSLLFGGFSLALIGLAALSFTDAQDRSGILGLSLLSAAAAAGACTGLVAYIGSATGRDLRKLSSYFDALFNIEADKTISGIRVVVPARVPVKEVKDMWVSTAEVMGIISRMRRTQKEVIEGMVEGQRLKTLFLASMSHDLKSPLNSIIGFSELLLKGIEGELNEEQREDIQIIHDSGEELLSIINNVLDYSRLEAGTLEIHKEWTPSVEILSGVVKSESHMIGGKNITIQTEVEPGLPPIFVDPARISQVLSSLISNAVKFMAKGTITLKVHQTRGLREENDKYMRIDVIDTGMGIKQADMDKIFDSFKQVDSSFSRRSSGLGLGLSLSKELIELHRGRIWVESKVGQGSVFSVGIPLEPV